RSSCAAGSSRRRTRAGSCGCRSSAPRRASARPRWPWSARGARWARSPGPRRCPSAWRCGRWRRSASGRLPARGRTWRTRDPPAGRNARGAGCRYGAIRAARGRGCADRRATPPRRAPALAPGLRDDLRLALVLLRVQHVVRDPALLQEAGEHLALGDADRTDQHRLALLPALLHVVAHRLELLPLGLVDGVLKVLPD